MASIKDRLTLDAPPIDQALATIPEDLVRDRGKGKELVDPNDVRPALLRLCQAKTPQGQVDDLKQIQGLKELDLFNDLSEHIYGRGPLQIVVIRSLGFRHMELAPFEEGGGVIDFNVPPDDPRTKFRVNPEGGKSLKPIATKFMDYLVWLPETDELVAWSLKSTQLKVGIKLNGWMDLPLRLTPGGPILTDPPSWARMFTIKTFMEKNKALAWGNYQLKMIGTTPVDTRELCAAINQQYLTKNIIIDTTDERGGDDVVSEEAGEPQQTDDGIPF